MVLLLLVWGPLVIGCSYSSGRHTRLDTQHKSSRLPVACNGRRGHGGQTLRAAGAHGGETQPCSLGRKRGLRSLPPQFQLHPLGSGVAGGGEPSTGAGGEPGLPRSTWPPPFPGRDGSLVFLSGLASAVLPRFWELTFPFF